MNGFPKRAQIELTRQRYPPGTRLELVQMNGDPKPVPPGTRGTVVDVDGIGQLVMKWDNGRTLSLVPGVDQFRKLPEQTMTMVGLYHFNGPIKRNVFSQLQKGGDLLKYQRTDKDRRRFTMEAATLNGRYESYAFVPAVFV